MSKHSSQIAKRRTSLRESGAEEYSSRRDKIFTAAAQLFKTRGYHATSLNDVAEAAGMERATLYYYVSGKQEILQEIIQHACLENLKMVEALAESDEPAVDRIRTFIARLMNGYRDQYPHVFVYLKEDMQAIGENNPDWQALMHEYRHRFDNALTKIVQAGLDDGSIRPFSDARLIAYGITGMLNWSHRWFSPDRGYTSEMIGRDFSEMVLLGLTNR